MTAAPLLAIDGLTIAFGRTEAPVRAVTGMRLEIPAGGSLGLVGESGSGKSLTALAILRLLPDAARVMEGSVRFDGEDLLALPPERLPGFRGRDVAMIFQEPMSALNPLMTIGDQVGEAILLHEDVGRAERRRRVLELLARVGIPDAAARLDAYPHQFSGGMRQRVMIAMALACGPRLLIADEPTTALDVTIQAQVLDLIRSIRRTMGTALLLISHDLGIVAETCDRVSVMYAGRVVETGTTRAIFRDARHPYTRGLLDSIPRLRDERRRLVQIPGSVPAPGAIAAGCPFAPRCASRVERCVREMPPMTELGHGHAAACWVTAGPGP